MITIWNANYKDTCQTRWNATRIDWKHVCQFLTCPHTLMWCGGTSCCALHFCGAFVECFRSDVGAAALLDADDFEDALRRLQAEQEGATADELMRAMKGFVDERTAAIFMEDAGVL